MMKHGYVPAASLALLAGLVFSEPVSATTTYLLTDLGTLGAPEYPDVPPDARGKLSEAYALAGPQQIVGRSGDPVNRVRAVVWPAPSDPAPLGPPSEAELSEAAGINDMGDAVGFSSVDGGIDAFFWPEGGGYTNIGTLGGPRAYAHDINLGRMVVGTSEADSAVHGNWFNRAFAWTPDGGLVHLGTLPAGSTSGASAVNEAGAVVGVSTRSTGYARAVLWSGGSPMDLGTLGGPSPNSEATDINDSGEIVGISSTSDEVTHAFYRSAGGILVDLGTLPGGWSSRANAINDEGVIVGASDIDANSPDAGIKHAVIWTQPGPPFDLNDLASAPSWTLLEATDIDDQGNIVGVGIHPSGDRHGFLLTPDTPTPILLSEFDASVGAREVALYWALGGDAGIVAVHVYREADHTSGEVRLSEQPVGIARDGRGSFLDQNVEPDRRYRYRLGLLDAEGNEAMSHSIEVRTAARPRVAMGLPHPSPTRAGFDVRVELEEAGRARLSLFDTAGRLLSVLFDGQLQAGERVLSWSSSSGDALGSGVYIAVLEAGGTTVSRRVMILR